MHPSKAWRLGFAAAVCAAAATLASAAESGSFRAPSSGERLRANERLSVTWLLDRPALAERDEMELVLSLDGGATFPIRVTGELSTSLRTLEWRVPSLPTELAVLALRAGNDGDEDSETILAVSEPFAIAAEPLATPEPLYAVADEWRTGDALDGAPVRPVPGDLASPKREPEVSSADGEANESEMPTAAAEPGGDEADTAISLPPPRLRPSSPDHPSTSLPLPLRL